MKNDKIVIVGGVAAGTKAAAKLRRELPNAQITIITREKNISYAGCGLPYYIGGLIEERATLIARTPEEFKNLLDVDVLTEHEAESVNWQKKILSARNLQTKEVVEYPYDALIVATGANPFGPPIEGMQLKNVFTLRTVEDSDAIKEQVASGKVKSVLVVGGGFIGLEVAENLHHRGIQTTIIEMLEHILPGFDKEIALLAQKHICNKGVEVVTGEKVIEFKGNDKGAVVGAVTDKGREIKTDLVLWSIGVRPNVEFAKKCHVELGSTGAIRVNRQMQTNIPAIYAVGDCAECFHRITNNPVWIPMGSTANKMGRVAAMNISGNRDEMAGVLGTTIVQLFGMNIGRTGLSTRVAREQGFDIETVVVPLHDRAHYYPGAKLITLKLVVARKTHRVLGAQAIGEGNIDKPIDILVTLISLYGTVNDLTKMDFAYAPPFSPAMSVVITAANVMLNKLGGKMIGTSVVQCKERADKGEEIQLVDVRPPEEFTVAHIEGSKNIPWGKLREKIGELDKKKETIVICKIGRSSYGASLTMHNEGFKDVKVLEGGMTVWPFDAEGQPAAK
jgi:NADPH-dependent 2,4-dienoyl-CoA reductase/sulfur reductase-like enzyme/rhodanese-related sulfurtransferase